MLMKKLDAKRLDQVPVGQRRSGGLCGKWRDFNHIHNTLRLFWIVIRNIQDIHYKHLSRKMGWSSWLFVVCYWFRVTMLLLWSNTDYIIIVWHLPRNPQSDYNNGHIHVMDRSFNHVKMRINRPLITALGKTRIYPCHHSSPPSIFIRFSLRKWI